MAINIDHTKHLISPNASTTIKFDTTGSIVIPVGTQSQRPGTAITGALRFNTQANAGDGGVEYYDGTAWQGLLSGGTFSSFKTISVAGQSDLVADSSTDTLTFAEGTGITITTDAASDLLTITLDASIDDLTDVDTTSTAPTSGQALLWNSTTSKWEPGNVSVANALDDLTDVTLTAPTTDQVLKYNGTEWVNTTVSIDELDDVAITAPVTNGFVLAWDSVAGKWTPTSPGGGGGGGGATYLDDLLDVETDGVYTPSNGQALRWDSALGIWKPSSGANDTDIAIFTYTGDGTVNSFSFAPNSVNSDEDLLVTVNGLLQDPGTDYNISGTNVTFTSVPTAGDIVNIRVIRTAGGQLSITVSEIDSLGNVVDVTTDVTALRFDQDSGFDVQDLGGGEVKIMMNSTFKYWEVDGQDTLVATGLDTIKFVPGTGIVITTDISSDPKEIGFALDADLNDLGDVTITTPTAGQVLKYNGTAWVNDTDSTGGGGGASTLNDLTDVDTAGATNGQVLKYNSTTGLWAPADDLNDGSGTGAGVTLLDALAPNGTLDTFDLEDGGTAFTPTNAESLHVTINGVYQIPYAAYEVAGSTITFAEAPLSSDVISIINLASGGGGGGGGGSVVATIYRYSITSTTDTISGADDATQNLSYTAGSIGVYLNGILLKQTSDYTATNGTSVVFADDLVNGDYVEIITYEEGTGGGGGGISSITVRENGVTKGNVTTLNFVNSTVTVAGSVATVTGSTGGGSGTFEFDAFSGDGTTDTFALTDAPDSAEKLLVYIDGVVQPPGVAYDIVAGDLEFVSAPPSGTDIYALRLDSGGSGGGGGGATDLDDLTDVVVTTPSNGQILQYNGTNWVNATFSGLHSADTTVYFATTTTVDTFSKTTYRSAKYLLQATTGTDYHVTEIILLHDDTNVYVSEYGTLFTDTSLIAVTADISGTDVRLRVTPVGAPTSVKLKRIDLEV